MFALYSVPVLLSLCYIYSMPVFRIWSSNRKTRKTVACDTDIDSLLQKGKQSKLLYMQYDTAHLNPVTGTSEFMNLALLS